MITLSYKDFQQQVCGSYVFILPGDKAPGGTCAWVEDAEGREREDERDVGDCRFMTPSGTLSLTWRETKERVVYGFPPMTLFNLDKRMLLFSRKIIKQFHKSPTNQNSCITDPVAELAPSKRRMRMNKVGRALTRAPNIDLDLPVWNAISSRVYPELSWALAMLTKGHISVAISPEYGLVAQTKLHGGYPIMHYSSCIGHLLTTIRANRFGRWEYDLKPINKEFTVDVQDFANEQLKGITWNILTT